MPCGWEGNRRSGDVALAMCHELRWFIYLRAHGLRKREDHFTFTRVWWLGWLGSRVVSVLDSGAEGPGSNRSRDTVG